MTRRILSALSASALALSLLFALGWAERAAAEPRPTRQARIAPPSNERPAPAPEARRVEKPKARKYLPMKEFGGY